jgi:YHS domain-containing protein
MRNITTLLAVSLAAITFAQHAHPAPKVAPKIAMKAAAKPMTCAVMPANKVSVAAATKAKMFADYKGNRYFFCCDGCPQMFKKSPAKYAKAAHIKTPKLGK